MLVPADAIARASSLDDLRRVQHRAERDLKEPGEIGRALRVRQRERLLGRKGVATALRLILDVAAGGLGVEPLAHVALRGAGALGQLAGRQRACAGKRSVEAQLVSHHDERGVQGRADLLDGAEHELVQLVLIDCN